MPQGKNQVVLCNFLLGHRKPRIRYVETTNISRRYSWLWLQAGIKLFYRLFYDAMFFFFCLLLVFQPRTQACSRYPSDQRRLGTERDRRIFPTSLTGDVTSEIAEDDWERGCQALRSTQNTRRHCCDGDFRLVYFRSEFRSM